MEDHGARGVKEMHDAGAQQTLAEGESSCVVFSIPKEANKLGGVDKNIALDHIADEILHDGDANTA